MNLVFRRFVSIFPLVTCTLAFATATAAEQHHRLETSLEAVDKLQVEVKLEVGGHLQLAGDDEVVPVPIRVDGKMRYDEVRLDGPANAGPQRDAASAARAVRHYHEAGAKMAISGQEFTPQLRDERRQIVAAATAEGVEIASPKGPLTRDELDLMALPGDSLLVDELLPPGEISEGDEWTHSNELLAALLGLDAVSASDVKSRLVEFTDQLAKIEMEGHVDGAVAGVASEIEVKAKYAFHRQANLVSWLALLVNEKRSIGHVAPGLDTVAKLQMTRQPLDESTVLDAAAIRAARETTESLLLEHPGPTERIRLVHDRDWYTVGDEANLAAFRLVDRGELVAQCNVSAANLPAAKEITSVEAFQEQVRAAIADHVGQFVEVTSAPHPRGYGIYRVVAEGTVAELPIRWIYYLVFDRAGNRAALVFTLETDLIEQFGDRDRDFVDRLEFVTEAAQTAGRGESRDMRR